jgi:hypothetical protein
MKALDGCSSVQYAVIQGCTEGRPERFAIGYCNEASLRDLIAAPSIIVLGFASRAKAMARIESCFAVVPAPRWELRTTIIDETDKCQNRFHSVKRQLRDRFRHAEIRKAAERFLQRAVADAIRIFYSRNAVSAGIRILLGASF